jgi:cobyrinic acid a,c-diamide synthase
MRHLPRFAVGTIQPGACRDAVVWGLVAALADAEDSPVLFRSSCDFAPHDPAKPILGRASRHLDSWAMSRSDAIAALAQATGPHDMALVEGIFDRAKLPTARTGETPVPRAASSLDRLCEWLDLPRIAVVDVRALAQGGTARRPARIDGLLLDRVNDVGDAAYWQTTLEALWKTPVLGWLDEAAPLRALCASIPAGGNPSRELCHGLCQRLLPTLRLSRLRQLASRAAPLSFEPEAWLLPMEQRGFRIAVAMDEAYCGYYPETLDLLESSGAELCDFSPLRSEAIPDDIDVVYFGCGHPERDPERLAANHCLKQSLRCFAAGGGRIYAEGSGLAYLCREIALPCGRTIAMTGLLPATARWLGQTAAAEPSEVTFGTSSWLAPARISLRGYRHNGWQIEPRGPMITYAAGADQRLDVLGRANVIGSRVLINLAANRHLLRRFFEPYEPVVSGVRRSYE